MTSPTAHLSRRLRPIQRFLLRYGLATLAISIAAAQFFAATTSSLSRWKGGGYGMYSDFHELHNDILVTDEMGEPIQAFSVDPELVRRVRVWPSKTNVNELLDVAARAAPTKPTCVQVWVLDFDPNTMRLKRRLRREHRANVTH